MKIRPAALTALLLCACTACSAPKTTGSADVLGQTGSGPVPKAAMPRPWADAQKVINATAADIQKSSFQGIASHVQELEAVLAAAQSAYDAPSPPGGPVYRLVDGSGESLEALLATTITKPQGAGGKVVAVQSPYVVASFLLSTYYNEVRRPVDALRVLDAGLALPNVDPDLGAGSHRPKLLAERGAAFVLMKRWPDALASYDKGLALTGVDPHDRGQLLRGRGFALTELGRLDEAEKSYRDSLAADPGNKLALQELDYIAKLRAGGARSSVELLAPNAPKPAAH